MIVRSFQLADYQPLSGLLEDVLTEECYEDTMQAIARQIGWDSDLVLVAEQDDEIVGMVMGTIDNNTGYFYRVAVANGHQRKGIGKSLIAALKQRFLIRRVNKIMITVDIHNEVVLPVYESAGYRASDFSRTPHRLAILKKISG
ncbi:GNAT family N-acetyltransferase [Paenibacillus chartarius]|uniref:GNAT family N-acetyltransferase n=1 Tax=Paenibacillus chartarius TaxID=747481 RepID=A0ABV6DSH0_9BACL